MPCNFSLNMLSYYAIKTFAIPNTEASITTHFQQLSLFIFIVINFISTKIHITSF
jgi:hypothetical protein